MPCTPCSATVDPRIVDIERRRAAAGLSQHQFLQRADVPADTWRDLRRGRRRPLPATLLKLNAALAGARPQAKPPAVIAAFHRLVMLLVAERLALDPTAVLATDFSVQRPQNATWRAASEVRLIAIYITAVELQVENPEIADALGVSREAVRKARNRVEDLRDDAARDALIEEVAQKVRP